MSESLRNDGRIWVPKNKDKNREPGDIPQEDRDYYLERRYPAFGNLVPRDVASRAAKERMDAGHGVGTLKNAVYLDFKTAIDRLGVDTIKERYGNLFTMYQKNHQYQCLQRTDENFSCGAFFHGRFVGLIMNYKHPYPVYLL